MKLKRQYLTLIAVATSLVTACSTTKRQNIVSAPIMDNDAKAMYLQRIIPTPQSAEFKSGNFYRIAQDCNVELVLPNSEKSKKYDIRKTINMLFQKYWVANAIDINMEKGMA